MGAFFSGGKGWITEPRRFSAWFGDPRSGRFREVAANRLSKTKSVKRTSTPYKRHPKMGAFFCGGKGWINEPRRFSAWFGCPPKAAAFAKLLPTSFRRQKREASLHPLTKGTRKWVPFSVVGRGGFTNHGALARGSAVRRRRQLSRSCCQPAFEDEKREANLHPLTKGTKFMVPAYCAEKGWIYEPRRFSAWFGCPPKAAAFAKLPPTGSRRRKAGSEPPLD